MKLRRTGWLAGTLLYAGLFAASLWLLSLDTLAQANWRYTASALLLFTGVLVVIFAVRRYRKLDELTQRIHLIALAVAFIGTLFLVFVWGILVFFRVIDDGEILLGYVGSGLTGAFGLLFAGMMLVLYLVGWFWGRSLYQ